MPSAQGYFTLSAAHISAIRQILKKQTSGSEHVYPCGPGSPASEISPAALPMRGRKTPHWLRLVHIFNCIELLQFRKHCGGVNTGDRTMMKLAIETIGWIAAAIMLAAYVMLTTGRLSGRSNFYHWLNILSGAGFIINSGWNGAYPSASINVVWVAIGLYGVFGRRPADAANSTV
jgi:hypothetical protein